MDDVLEGFWKIRELFLEHGLEPPEAIFLKSHEEGAKFLRALSPRLDGSYSVLKSGSSLCRPVHHPDGSIWIELNLMGMKVHWSAAARSSGCRLRSKNERSENAPEPD